MSKTYKRNKFDDKREFFKKKDNYLRIKGKQRDRIVDKRQFLRVDLTQKEES